MQFEFSQTVRFRKKHRNKNTPWLSACTYITLKQTTNQPPHQQMPAEPNTKVKLKQSIAPIWFCRIRSATRTVQFIATCTGRTGKHMPEHVHHKKHARKNQKCMSTKLTPQLQRMQSASNLQEQRLSVAPNVSTSNQCM